MHLLFNDPSTSPRTELGRIIYGALYGLSVVGLYQLLGSAGMPTFYDKLLQVPFLNLSVKAIDRRCAVKCIRASIPQFGRSLLPRQRNLAYMSIWAVVFAAMSATQGVGDSHPGQWLPFWRQACEDGRRVRLPLPCRFGRELLQSRIGLGVQRSRPHAYRARRGRARIFAGSIPRELRNLCAAAASSGSTRPAGI